MNLDLDSIKGMLIAGVAAAFASLLAGRLIRRLLLLPFKKIAEKTENKTDDQLIEDAEKDLGLDDK